jgi:hypothetical protein
MEKRLIMPMFTVIEKDESPDRILMVAADNELHVVNGLTRKWSPRFKDKHEKGLLIIKRIDRGSHYLNLYDEGPRRTPYERFMGG